MNTLHKTALIAIGNRIVANAINDLLTSLGLDICATCLDSKEAYHKIL